MSDADVAAIVLAGGASRRFGRDKLAEPVRGRPLLEHAIDAVRPVAGSIVVVLAPGDERHVPPDVRVVHDPIAHQGPLAGVVVGLSTLDAGVERVIVLGGDMASVAPAVLADLLARVADPRVASAWLRDDEGHERPLPLALRVSEAAAQAVALLATSERRLRALPLALDAVAVPPVVWRPLDPDGATLRDVDTPEDLPTG
jgi:molybdopterin-guanine dinucleotide biosynthesis protein A